MKDGENHGLAILIVDGETCEGAGGGIVLENVDSLLHEVINDAASILVERMVSFFITNIFRLMVN